jgi:hypothetical protein
LRPTRHLERGAAGKRQKQHALGRHAREKQVCDAVRQGARLAGAGARDDEQRPRGHPAPGFHLAVPDRLALGRV